MLNLCFVFFLELPFFQRKNYLKSSLSIGSSCIVLALLVDNHCLNLSPNLLCTIGIFFNCLIKFYRIYWDKKSLFLLARVIKLGTSRVHAIILIASGIKCPTPLLCWYHPTCPSKLEGFNQKIESSSESTSTKCFWALESSMPLGLANIYQGFLSR